MIRTWLLRTLLLALACVVTACGGASPSTGAATSSPEPGAESAAAPAPTDTASGATTVPPMSEPAVAGEPTQTRCEEPISADAGSMCVTSVFEPTLSFTLPPGWAPDVSGAEEPFVAGFVAKDNSEVYLGITRVARVYEYPTGGGRPKATDAPADMAAYLAGLPGVDAGEPTSRTVDGRDASQIDLTIRELPPALPRNECGQALEPALYVFELASGMRSIDENTRVMDCQFYYFVPDTEVRAVTVDLEGEEDPLVLVMEATSATRDTLFAQFDAMVTSMRIDEG